MSETTRTPLAGGSDPRRSGLSNSADSAPSAGDDVIIDLTGPAIDGARPDAIRSLTRVTDALRNSDGHRLGDTFAAVVTALSASPGERCVAWHVSSDGTRMRRVAEAPTEPRGTLVGPSADDPSRNRWWPADGAVAQVLGARRTIEMGIVDDELVRSLEGSPLGRVEAGDDMRRPNRPFGRFLPIHQTIAGASRIIAVLGVIRAAGFPVFDTRDRVVLDAVAERLEAAVALQRTTDDLAGERSRRLVHGQGLIMGDELLLKLGTIGGDIMFRHLFGSGTDYISAGVTSSLGYTPQEVMTDEGLIDRLVHPDDRHLLTDLIDDPDLAAKPLQVRMIRRNGNLSWQLVRVLPIIDASGRVLGVEGLSTDVTAMKLAEAELSHQARSDPLTGLANRLNFREATARALARIERHHGMTGVLFLDLDGFKAVNDHHGHAAGDRVLVQVAERLRRVIRREDLVARLGGDEFAVLLAEIKDVGEAAATARRILEALDDRLLVNDEPAGVSTGIGIAVTRSGTMTPDELVNRADIALYQAKRAGRGRWQVYEGPNGTAVTSQPTLLDDMGVASGDPTPVHRPVVSEATIAAALAAGELRAHYLPELDTTTGKVVAVEALVRWQHPQLGLLDAHLFVPEADDLDLLHPVGDWVLREAARQVLLWRTDFDVPLRLWVNVTPRQLARPRYAEDLLTALAGVGLAPRDLGLEIDESAWTTLDAASEAVLGTLDKAGVKLAVDSFGTGTSSLRSLRRLPLTQVKLDRSLVDIVDRTGGDAELVPLAIKLALSLGADVVAVGVERPAQLERLRELGCAYFEGALAGGVRTPEQITQMFENGQQVLPLAFVADTPDATDIPGTPPPAGDEGWQ